MGLQMKIKIGAGLVILAITTFSVSGALAQTKRQQEKQTSPQAAPGGNASSVKQRCCVSNGWRWDGSSNTCYTGSERLVPVLWACMERGGPN